MRGCDVGRIREWTAEFPFRRGAEAANLCVYLEGGGLRLAVLKAPWLLSLQLSHSLNQPKSSSAMRVQTHLHTYG